MNRKPTLHYTPQFKDVFGSVAVSVNNRDTPSSGPQLLLEELRAAWQERASALAETSLLSRSPKASPCPLDREPRSGRHRKGLRHLGAGRKLDACSPSRVTERETEVWEIK